MTPREASLDWCRRALSEELREPGPIAQGTLAEALVGMAEDLDIPVEELIAWIHSSTAKKAGWTPEAWKLHTKAYAALRERLTQQRNRDVERRLPEGWPE